MVYKQIIEDGTNGIIDKLKLNANLATPNPIRRYYFGAPVRILEYPAIYVQFNGRTPTDAEKLDAFLYELEFEIGVVDRNVNEDDADKSVYDKIEEVDAELSKAANLTLGGSVENLQLPRRIEIVRISEGDYAVSVARYFAVYRKWMR